MTKLGYLIPTREQVMSGVHEVKPLLELARYAQQLGYDSLWVGDSLFSRARHDPLTLIAALAGAAERVELGTAVLLPALRNPVVLAQQLATLDQICTGRLIVGAGIAADAPTIRNEFRAAGVPFEKRVGRFNEGFDLCRALWTGEPVSWDGRWQLENVQLLPRPYRPGGPPIWLASRVDAGVLRAARRYDGWFPIGPNSTEVARQHELAKQEAKLLAKSSVTAVYLTVCVGADREAPNRQIDDYLQQYYGAPPELLRSVQACCGGTVDDVMGFIRSFVQAGASHIVLRIVGDHFRTLEVLAEHRGQLPAVGV